MRCCRGQTVGLTLWGDSAEVQGAELEQSKDTILSVSSCRVGDFNGALNHHSICKQHCGRRPASGIEVGLLTVGLEEIFNSESLTEEAHASMQGGGSLEWLCLCRRVAVVRVTQRHCHQPRKPCRRGPARLVGL